MKTIKKVQQDIASTIEEIKTLDSYTHKAAIKRLKAKLPTMRLCVSYLRTSPSEEFIRKEAERLTDRISAIEKLYVSPPNADFIKKSQVNAHRKAHEKNWDIPKLKKQLAVIWYLLK